MEWVQLEAMADRMTRQGVGRGDAEIVRIIEQDAAARLSRRDALRLAYLYKAREIGRVDHARIDAQVELDIADSMARKAGFDLA